MNPINDVLGGDKSISNKKKDKKEKELKMKDIFEIKNAKYKRIVMKKEKNEDGKTKLVKKPIDIKGVKKSVKKDVPKYAEENYENMIVNRAIKINAKKKTLI